MIRTRGRKSVPVPSRHWHDQDAWSKKRACPQSTLVGADLVRAGAGALFEVAVAGALVLGEAETVEAEELDVTIREVTYDYLATRNYEPDKKGVVVQKAPVAVRTNANRVVRGDLIVRIDEKEVADLDA